MSSTIHFTFPQPKHSGRVVAEFQNVDKSYGDNHVLGGVNFAIERGDRVALVGINGAGKSTLIKLLAGTEPLTSGEYRIGHNVQPDYFAQDQYKELDPEARLLDDLMGVANGKTITELRSLLGCFLFSEDDAFKPIGVLSGGERNRYALARMLLNPSNFLLLDEPTNHLDLKAKDVLLDSLQAFSGTVVFVSHDRYFIDKLATRVFEIEGGHVEVFPGNYEDYLWRKQRQGEAETAEASQPAAVEIAEAEKSKGKRTNPLKVKQLENKARDLEHRAAKLEAEIAKLEDALNHFVSAEDSKLKSERLEECRAELTAALAEWEEASLALEEQR